MPSSPATHIYTCPLAARISTPFYFNSDRPTALKAHQWKQPVSANRSGVTSQSVSPFHPSPTLSLLPIATSPSSPSRFPTTFHLNTARHHRRRPRRQRRRPTRLSLEHSPSQIPLTIAIRAVTRTPRIATSHLHHTLATATTTVTRLLQHQPTAEQQIRVAGNDPAASHGSHPRSPGPTIQLAVFSKQPPKRATTATRRRRRPYHPPHRARATPRTVTSST